MVVKLAHMREECRLRVFENKVLWRIFGPKRDDVTGEWRRLHKKELYALYFSPNIIRVINSRRLRWAGHVARMGEGEGHIGLLWRNLSEGDHLEDPGIDGRIILKGIFEKFHGGGLRLAGWQALVYTVMKLQIP
jgi:hypothetical protein